MALRNELLPLITLASIQSILQAAATASAGAILGARGMLKPNMTKGLALISTKVAIPCLLFGKMLRTVRLELVMHAWPMMLLPFLVVAIACCVGYLTVLIAQPPQKHRGTLIAAIAFGNSTSMPILLLSVITDTLQDWWLRANHVRDFPHEAADPIVYIGIYGITYPVLTWGVASWLLQPVGEAEPARDGSESQPREPVAPANHSLPAAQPPSKNNSAYTSLEQPLLGSGGRSNGSSGTGCGSSGTGCGTDHAQGLWAGCVKLGAALLACARASRPCLVAAWAFVRARLLLPPTIGVMLGLLCAAWPPLYFSFCGGEYGKGMAAEACPQRNAPLGWLLKGVVRLGEAFIPLQMIILGNALSRGPSCSVLPMRTTLLVAVAKMVAVPCLAMCAVLAVHAWGVIDLTPPWDEPFYLTALVVTSTPSANNLMVITELYGGDRSVMSTLIFMQYALAPLLLTATLMSSVVLVLSLHPIP